MITFTLAAITDTRTGKIPNWLTFPFIIFGMITYFLTPMDIQEAILRLILSAGFMCAVFLGGGDRKLFMGAALLYPAKMTLFVFLAGNVIAAGYMFLKSFITKMPIIKSFSLRMGMFFMFGFIAYILWFMPKIKEVFI